MPFSIQFAAGVIDKLLEGREDLLGDVLLKKLEGMGEDLIMDFVGGPLSSSQRVTKAIDTGGESEFDKARNKFISGFKPAQLPYSGMLRKIGRAFGGKGRGGAKRSRHGAKPGTWQASSWAASREDWLDQQWQHDWRSQPRDVRGRWIPGRLEYIAEQLKYRGKRRAGRLTLRRRKLRKMRKIATRRMLRDLMKAPKKRRRKNPTGDAI